jgi:hypothetical protein
MRIAIPGGVGRLGQNFNAVLTAIVYHHSCPIKPKTLIESPIMRRALLLLAFLSIAHAPVMADEIADALRAALEAYEAGDFAGAQEEAGYASQLLAQRKAAGLAKFLPEALPGWTLALSESQAQTNVMFGGGMTAGATYTNTEGLDVEMQLLADSPMAAMFANPAMMGMFGQVRRINRTNFAISPDGNIQGMVGGVLIQVSGSGSEADKIAYLEKMDFRALATF